MWYWWSKTITYLSATETYQLIYMLPTLAKILKPIITMLTVVLALSFNQSQNMKLDRTFIVLNYTAIHIQLICQTHLMNSYFGTPMNKCFYCRQWKYNFILFFAQQFISNLTAIYKLAICLRQTWLMSAQNKQCIVPYLLYLLN